MTPKSHSWVTNPITAMAMETPTKKNPLAPTMRLASSSCRRPRCCPIKMVAAMATPKALPINKNKIALTLEVAERAEGPR